VSFCPDAEDTWNDREAQASAQVADKSSVSPHGLRAVEHSREHGHSTSAKHSDKLPTSNPGRTERPQLQRRQREKERRTGGIPRALRLGGMAKSLKDCGSFHCSARPLQMKPRLPHHFATLDCCRDLGLPIRPLSVMHIPQPLETGNCRLESQPSMWTAATRPVWHQPRLGIMPR